MKEYMKIFGKTAVAIFVLWHAFAVAAYTVPRPATDAVSTWIEERLLPIAKPYMLATSQWQLWNLFSPDPLRRVTAYVVEARFGDEWVTVKRFDHDTYSVWRHSPHYKLMSNLYDEFSKGREPLVDRFLRLQCDELRFGDDMPIRLVYESYVIPKHERRQTRAWWDAWKPNVQRSIGHETTCSPTT